MSEYATSKITRENLIQAAGELTAEQGFNNVSIRAIARKAGENVGSIHYHFGGKDGLLEEVVRKTFSEWLELPLKEYIAPYIEQLDTPAGQARALRAVMHHHIVVLFRVKRPSWHSRVLYQVLQHNNPFRPLLNEAVIEPNDLIMRMILRKIKPDMSEEEIFLYSRIILSPIILHANYTETILELLRQDDYSQSYLQKLEDIIVRQTLLLFNLENE